MQFFHRILNHLRYFAEVYFWIPLLWLLMVVVLCVVHRMTGRSIIDSPEAVIGWFYNAIGAGLAMFLTGLAQHHLFGYRAETDPDYPPQVKPPRPPLADDVYDSCITAFLLLLFSVALFWF